MPPSEATARAGVKAEDITDVIISRALDHLDGMISFPGSRLDPTRGVRASPRFSWDGEDRAIDAGDAKILAAIARQGRVMLVDGDAREIIPGIHAQHGRQHTFASQLVTVNIASGTVVLASTTCTLRESRAPRPVAQTLDWPQPRTQARMVTLASDQRLIIPGHDPDVFVRFPRPATVSPAFGECRRFRCWPALRAALMVAEVERRAE